MVSQIVISRLEMTLPMPRPPQLLACKSRVLRRQDGEQLVHRVSADLLCVDNDADAADVSAT